MKIKDTRQARKTSVSLKDALLSALAVFSFKWPSLLSFEIDMQHDEVIAGNLRRLFHIDRIPSDTTMREIIDEIPPEALHEVFTRIFAALQRGKDLEPYVFSATAPALLPSRIHALDGRPLLGGTRWYWRLLIGEH